ncbi:Radical SAM domain protein [Ferroglobus placidus DSM 10642]|uniref:Radical SAM domain protein n=1 Tax=Ferroglobus placidus (strain DSM 10642 / AEDII12DO) TaxID=589924 RepID=D3S3G4_FERPA|nr:radical SAM protein [Ferroglobus placidus]ADC64797.1 Radical SAM domain protein [Ferroglobus placidus DSM 10642]
MSKVILTAERSLMSDYNGALFLGFMSTGPTSMIPQRLFFRLIAPPVKEENGRAKLAPYGTRKIEAALLENGFSEDEVKVVNPDKIEKHITKETKIVGVTTNDPLGLGPASSTFSGETGFVNQPSYNRVKFEELMRKLRRFDVKVVVGGAGAWQLEEERIRRKYGIDVVVIGEGEKVVPELFRKIIEGEDVPEVVYGVAVPEDEIPKIRRAAIGGIVEIARGCGRGCKFCIPTMRRLRSRPLEDILEEARVTARDKDIVTLHAEDVLRYKAKGFTINKEEVLRLFREVHRIVGKVGISHFALSSVASAPDVVEEISEILELPNKEQKWLAGQTGIETGSPRLIEKYMPGKAKPFSASEWRDVVIQAFQICSDAHWVPCATLIVGFPDEREEDIIKTIELVEDLNEYKSLIVPLFFVPANELGEESRFSVRKMKSYHWELMLTCWRHNMKWLKPLAKDYFEGLPFASKIFMKKFIDWVVDRVSKSVEEYILQQIEITR